MQIVSEQTHVQHGAGGGAWQAEGQGEVEAVPPCV